MSKEIARILMQRQKSLSIEKHLYCDVLTWMFPIDVDDWWFLVEIGSSSLIGARGNVRKNKTEVGCSSLNHVSRDLRKKSLKNFSCTYSRALNL